MGTTLANAYVQIIPSAKGIKSGMQKELDAAGGTAGESAGGRFAGSFKNIIGAAAIGTAVVAGITKSIKEGAALEQSIGGIETLFKSASDTVIKNADNAFRTAGISANSYMEQATSFSASLLQSLDGDTKKAAKYADTAIIDMSDNANKMGTNIEDIQNAYQGFAKQNYTMLDNLKLGYGGTKTEMERLLADASKISGQKYDISNLSDVYEAIHVIQGDLDITGTSAKEAATTLSGSFSAMNAAADNFLGNLALGRNIESSMEGLASTASIFLFDNLVPAIGRILTSLPTALGTFIKKGVPQFMAAGKEMMDGIAKGFGNSGDIIKKALSGLTDLSGMISKAAPGLVDTGMDLLQNLAQGIADGLPEFIESVPEIISNFADAAAKNGPKLIKGGLLIIKTLAVGIIKAIPALIKTVPKIFKAYLNMWKSLGWVNLGKLALTAIRNGIVKGIGALASIVRGKFNAVKTAITQPITAARNVLSNIVSAIKSRLSFSGLSGSVGRAFGAIKAKMTAPISSALSTIRSAVSKIRGIFPLRLGKIFSGIQVPHFNISGGKVPWGIGGKGVKPSVSVKWYKTGGIFNDPSVIGVGEAGSEAVVPLGTLWSKFDALTSAVLNNNDAHAGNLNLIIQLDGKTIGKSTVDYINGQTMIFGTSPVL
uniref:Tail tape measure protein n=1 Tax=Siphoviridae sp. ctkKt3 TaxID=2825642 RepID=A0A8S5UYU2_9CAUD|nr:MAG TPA: tail tape measure protein [Siphoviridae sp. ctkKt3]